MNRREFIKMTTLAGISSLMLPGCISQSGLLNSPAKNTRDIHSERNPSAVVSDKSLVIAEGNDPESLMDKGLRALGGIDNFIKPGGVVVIKPNFSSPVSPDVAVTTNPALVGALVKQCFKAGAKDVRVIDHTAPNGEMCLDKTGIRPAVVAAGGRAYVINSRNEQNYQKVLVSGEILKQVEFSRDVLEADSFINVSILKQNDLTGITSCLKNLMGLVWDRGLFHKTDLHRTIAELGTVKKPTLVILDAIKGITANGPFGPGPIKEWNQVVFGTDMLAVDAYGADLLGINPMNIRHLVIGAELGLGTLDWRNKEIVRV